MCLHWRDYAEQAAAGVTDGELAATLSRHGMRHVSVEFLSDWFMDGEAGQVARAHEELAFRAARVFGAPVLNVGPDLLGRDVPAARMRAAFRALCQRAAAEKLAVALEIVAWGNVRDVETALRMIDDIPNAGLVIDSWHVFRGGIPFADLQRIPPARILCVQVNDAAERMEGTLAEDTLHRRPCGDGTFDLPGFTAVLDGMGVAQPFSVEVLSPALAGLSAEDAAALSFQTTAAAIPERRPECSRKREVRADA
jgi:sugar phosphate isomerase/epimerase